MKCASIQCAWLVWLLGLGLLLPWGLATQEPQAAQPASPAPAAAPAVPHLADLIPLATAVSGRTGRRRLISVRRSL